MIFSTGIKQRNYNFVQLIKNFNRLYKIHKNNPLPTDIKYGLLDGLIGDETISDIENDIFNYSDNGNNGISLVYYDSGRAYFYLQNLVLPVSTKEEAAIVYNMLIKGDFDLFLDAEAKINLMKNIKTYFKNIGINDIPVFDNYIVYKGLPISSDSLNDIKDNFIFLDNAISHNNPVSFDYYYNNQTERITVLPKKFIFSHLDLKFRIKAVIGGVYKTFYLDYMSNLSYSNINPELFKLIDYKKPKFNELILECKNEANVVERIAARFSDYNKTVVYNPKSNTVEYHIIYEDNPKENRRILIRLKYLETRIKVLSYENNILIKEALDTLELYQENML